MKGCRVGGKAVGEAYGELDPPCREEASYPRLAVPHCSATAATHRPSTQPPPRVPVLATNVFEVQSAAKNVLMLYLISK